MNGPGAHSKTCWLFLNTVLIFYLNLNNFKSATLFRINVHMIQGTYKEDVHLILVFLASKSVYVCFYFKTIRKKWYIIMLCILCQSVQN